MARSRIHNPGPAQLLLVNPTGGTKTMRRRRRTGTKTTTTRRRNSYGRRMMRRSNPNFGMVTKGLTLAGGGAITQFVTAMVPAIGGPGPLMDAARTGAVAYLLGMLAGRIGLSRWAGDITLGGFAVAGAKVINGILIPTAGNIFAPRPAPIAPTNGMGAIGLGPDYLTDPRTLAQRSGMAGIGMAIPGMVPFGAYSDSDPYQG